MPFGSLFTVDELATAFQVSVGTIHAICKSHKIPFVEINDRNLYQIGAVRMALNPVSTTYR